MERVVIYPFISFELFLHCYSSYTGGDIGNLRELTVDQIREYHREYYRPENLSIFICGNWGEDDTPIIETLLTIENAVVEKRTLNPPAPFERPWINHNHFIVAGDPSQSVRFLFQCKVKHEVTFPSSEVDNNNYYLNIAFKTTSIQDVRTNNLVELLLEFRVLSECNIDISQDQRTRPFPSILFMMQSSVAMFRTPAKQTPSNRSLSSLVTFTRKTFPRFVPLLNS